MKRKIDCTEENFEVMRSNIRDFEVDFWSLVHSVYLLDVLVGQYEKLSLDSENDEARNHLQFGIDLFLNSVMDLTQALYYFYHSMYDCKPYNG